MQPTVIALKISKSTATKRTANWEKTSTPDEVSTRRSQWVFTEERQASCTVYGIKVTESCHRRKHRSVKLNDSKARHEEIKVRGMCHQRRHGRSTNIKETRDNHNICSKKCMNNGEAALAKCSVPPQFYLQS